VLGTIPPFLLKTDDNPEGVDGQVFEGIKAAIVKDRYGVNASRTATHTHVTGSSTNTGISRSVLVW
jgi:hypothetical protein